jgi:beta-lactam-binding protein with PASTA domain
VVRDPSGPGAPGTVIAQTPVSGATLTPGASITLRVVAEPAPQAAEPPQEPAPQPAPPPVQQP